MFNLNLIKSFILSFGTGVLISTSCISNNDEKINKINKINESNIEIEKEKEKEKKFGRQLAGKLIKYFGLWNDAKATKYINDVGNYIASQSIYNDRNFMFEILNTNSINAFSCPGGYIFVTKGVLSLVKDEAELSMILSHEIVHVGNRHMIKTIDNNQNQDSSKKQVKERDKYISIRERSLANKSNINENISKFLIGSSGSSLSLLEGLQQGIAVMFQKGFDKDLEFEADSIGLQIATDAGYSPEAISDLLMRLSKVSEDKVKTLSKTHPPITNRLESLENQIKVFKEKNIGGVRVASRFKRNIKLDKSL